jgi:hypothetical protein
MDPVKILRELEAIHPGTKRAVVDKLMRRDGGISRVHVERYVLRSCEYVKLDLEFENDVVVRASKPYLESPFMD